MNAIIIDNLMSSFSFILLIFVALLMTSVLVLIIRIGLKNRKTEDIGKRATVFEKAFYLAPLAAIIINDKGHILEANQRACQLFDTTEDHLKDHFLDAYTILASNKSRIEAVNQQLKEQGSYDFQNQIKVHGERIDCNFSIYSLLPGLEPEYLVTIERSADVKNQALEQNLRIDRLNEIENTAAIGFWVYDNKTGKTIWSRGLYKLLAKPVNSTVPDLSFLSQFAPESQQSIQNLLMAMKNQQPYYDRVVLYGDDGIGRTVDLYLKVQRGMGSSVKRSLGILREVRESALTERTYSIYTALAQLKNLIIVVFDEDKKIDFVNEYTLHFLNETEETKNTGLKNSLEKIMQRVSDSDLFIESLKDKPILWQSFTLSELNKQSTFLFGIDLSLCGDALENFENESKKY